MFIKMCIYILYYIIIYNIIYYKKELESGVKASHFNPGVLQKILNRENGIYVYICNPD
jgi:hypothetical protein